MRRSDFSSPDEYIQALRRAIAQGDFQAAEQLRQEERRTDPQVAAQMAWEEQRDVQALADFIHLSDPDGDMEIMAVPIDLTAAEMLPLIQALTNEDYEGAHTLLAFDMAEALYQYCNDWHGGQGNELYSILSQLDFSPGAGWHNCFSNDNALELLTNLVNTEQRPGMPEPLPGLPDNLVILSGTDSGEAQIIQIGMIGSQYFLVLDAGICDALDEAASWCRDHAPGLLTEPEYELTPEGVCLHCGADPREGCKHTQEAEADLTYCDGVLWIASDEWYGNEVDYDEAKATLLARTLLIEGASRPAWGAAFRCGGDMYDLVVPYEIAMGQWGGEEENMVEWVADQLECDEGDIELVWEWYLPEDEEHGHEAEGFTSYSDAVDETIERYQHPDG